MFIFYYTDIIKDDKIIIIAKLVICYLVYPASKSSMTKRR